MGRIRADNEILKKLAMLKFVNAEITSLIATRQQWRKLGIFEELDHDNNITGKIEALKKQYQYLTGFIESIPDVTVRKIARLRFQKGYTWRKITDQVYGRYYEESSARSAFCRYISRYPKKINNKDPDKAKDNQKKVEGD